MIVRMYLPLFFIHLSQLSLIYFNPQIVPNHLWVGVQCSHLCWRMPFLAENLKWTSPSLADLSDLAKEKCKCSAALNDDLEEVFGSVSFQALLLRAEERKEGESESSLGDNSFKRGSDLWLLVLLVSHKRERESQLEFCHVGPRFHWMFQSSHAHAAGFLVDRHSK